MKAIVDAKSPKEQEIKSMIDQESKDFVQVLAMLKTDNSALYADSGVGCSTISENDAESKAIEEVTNSLKQKYGDDVIKEYGIQFKSISNKSFVRTSIIGGEINTSGCYTVIVVAYQNIK